MCFAMSNNGRLKLFVEKLTKENKQGLRSRTYCEISMTV